MLKKLLLVAALTMSVAVNADDLYLYWMVDQTRYGEFDYAKVKAGDTYLCYASHGAMTEYTDLYSNPPDKLTTGETYSGYIASSYVNDLLVEIWHDEQLVVSLSYAYDQWKDYTYADMKTGSAKALVVSGIPEPSSGLLLLLGFAGLALKRRRQA